MKNVRGRKIHRRKAVPIKTLPVAMGVRRKLRKAGEAHGLSMRATAAIVLTEVADSINDILTERAVRKAAGRQKRKGAK